MSLGKNDITRLFLPPRLRARQHRPSHSKSSHFAKDIGLMGFRDNINSCTSRDQRTLNEFAGSRSPRKQHPWAPCLCSANRLTCRSDDDQWFGDDRTYVKTIGGCWIHNDRKIKITSSDLIKQFSRRSHDETQINIWVISTKSCHRIVEVMHGRSIDHSHTNATNVTHPRQLHPTTKITCVGHNSSGIGQDLMAFIPK
jgi:hypothetical protein